MKKPRNLFSTPTVVITVLTAMLTTVRPIVEDIVINGTVDKSEILAALFALGGSLCTAAARYYEDDENTLYTSRFLPGINIEDANGNGIPDALESPHSPIDFL